MFDDSPPLLGLPAPEESDTVASHDLSSPVAVDRRRIIYGRDLNTSDLLLVGVNDALRQIMSEEYGIGDEFSWVYPSTFSTTSRKVIIDDGTHKFFIKQKPQYCCSPYNLTLSAQFQEHLAETTDFVPRIVETRDGEPYLKIGNTYFFTTEFIEGRLFNGSIRDVADAGAVLGNIHSLSQEFQFPNLRRLYASEDTLDFIDIAEHLPGAEGDEWRVDSIQAMRRVVFEHMEHLDQNVPCTINHADYAPFNLVYGPNGIIAVTDFDNVNYRPRVRDIAAAMISFCDGVSYAGNTSTLRRPIATTMNLEKVNAFLEGYIENASSLSEEEKADFIGEVSIRWVKLMALGIMRGDFNYYDVLEALPFLTFLEQNLPPILENLGN